MTDLERLLPDDLMAKAYDEYLAKAIMVSFNPTDRQANRRGCAAMRQSLAPAIERAKEEGRREGLYAANPAYPRIRGRCPRCHSESLFLGSGGYVTCSVIGCKDPGAVHDMLSVVTPPAAAAPEQAPEETR